MWSPGADTEPGGGQRLTPAQGYPCREDEEDEETSKNKEIRYQKKQKQKTPIFLKINQKFVLKTFSLS